MKAVWYEGEVPDRRPLRLSREVFYERVRRDARLTSRRQAPLLTPMSAGLPTVKTLEW